MHKIVIDTNVVISGLRSQLGASYRLLQLIGTGKFEIALSVPLVLEYESVAKRMKADLGLTARDIDDTINYFCSVGTAHDIHYLWRPYLTDPKDDMVLELALNAHAPIIVTFNTSDFVGAESFGIKVMTPKEFLIMVKENR